MESPQHTRENALSKSSVERVRLPSVIDEEELVAGSSRQCPSTNDDNKPIDSKKGNDADHGNRFQSKLLVLFFLRAINKGYDFYLGTELPDQGVKFDDLIFKYRRQGNEGNDASTWSYQYLQAKHRVCENDSTNIKENQLLEDAGDFSVPKYFRSYLELSRRGDRIEHCIICTNADISKKLVENNLQRIATPEMLAFEGFVKNTTESTAGKIPICYKLKDSTELRNKFQLKGHSISHVLAKKLLDCAINSKPLNAEDEKFRNYHMALIEEKVIDLDKGMFHQDFVGQVQLSDGAKELRAALKSLKAKKPWDTWTFSDKAKDTFGKIAVEPKEFNYKLPVAVTDEEITEFFNKFIFAVNTPNEDELSGILKEEVSEYLELLGTEFPTAYIFNKMVDWFKRKDSIWLSAEEGKELMLRNQEEMDSLRATSLSLDYQRELNKIVSFNKQAIRLTTEKLKPFTDSSDQLLNISTESPKFTAVKVIAALKDERVGRPAFKCDDSFLVTSTSRLLKGRGKQWMKNTLLKDKNPQQLLIVVCDDGSLFQVAASDNEAYLFSRDESDSLNGKKVVVIGKDNRTNSSAFLQEDAITYEQLSDDSKKDLLSKTVSFQGSDATVRELIGDGQPDNVLDLQSIEELLLTGDEERKAIPLYSRSRFEKSLYIQRKMKFDFHFSEYASLGKARKDHKGHLLLEQVVAKMLLLSTAKLYKINMESGTIDWIEGLKDDIKEKIWRKVWVTRKENRETHEDDLINKENWERRAVIINGVAGTGKSTVLSHYYNEIKSTDPNVWVIRIDLKYHFSSLAQYAGKSILSSAIDFITSLPNVIDSQSPFARSLLRHRLETGDRIVIMLDGFDEIDSRCKEKAIYLMKALIDKPKTSKPIRLYVTTRPDVADNLQFQLGQLAYSLENFSQEDQIKYLTSFWSDKLGGIKEQELNSRFQKIAELLVKRVSADLKDGEKSFIGIPLQCRILAECYFPQVQTDMDNARLNQSKETEYQQPVSDIVEKDQKFDLVSLYRMLMDTKRQVFLKEKVVSKTANHIVNDSLELIAEKIESHLKNLAVQTIVSNEKQIELLWPPRLYRSKSDNRKQVAKLGELGVRFGLVDRVNGKLEFLHRTYAEYLMAEYLYGGFHMDDDLQNGLLENETVRQLFAKKILVEDQYRGVRVFLDSMLTEIVDNEEWHKQGLTRTIPDRIKKIAHDCEYHRIVLNKNSNLFVFMFDCLQATSNKTQIQEIVGNLFEKRQGSKQFYEQNHQVFRRLIANCDITNERLVTDITLDMMAYEFELRVDTIENSMEMKKVLDLFFDFMCEAGEKGNLTRFLINRIEANDYETNLLQFLICQNGYENCLQQYLKIYSLVARDRLLVHLIEHLFKRYENWFHDESKRKKQNLLIGKTEKVLILLNNFKRGEVLARISHVVLKRDPRAFANFYQPKHPKEEEERKDESLKSELLDRDSARMTCLHRAIYYGEAEVALKILHLWVDQTKKANAEAKEATERVIACDDYGFTPCYVAYARKQKKLFVKVLEFLKEVLRDDDLKKYLMDEKGFLQVALLEALNFEEIDMLEMILGGIQNVFGQDVLLEDVLKSKYNERYMKLLSHRKKECFETIAKFLVDEHGNVDYEKLNEIVFQHPDHVVDVLKHVTTSETRKKMISADGGIGEWLSKRFLPMHRGFKELSRIIEKQVIELGDEGRQQLVDFGIAMIDEGYSIMDKRFNILRVSDMTELLRCILSGVSKEALEKVVLHKNCDAIIGTIESHPGEYMTSVFAFILRHLSHNENIVNRIKELEIRATQF